MSVKHDKAYYMDSFKFIRDLVHGYVYLTKFDLEIIDTPEFQRLKDIRQLTCQNVYPAARHTRFEHSLGVLELTRQALENLNQNQILTNPSLNEQRIFDGQMVFNARLAALLHDIGHCPFSHMGEAEFDKSLVYEHLCNTIKVCPQLQGSLLLEDFQKNSVGSTHEMLSCIIILENLYDKLSEVNLNDENDHFCVDFELIIRSIIGLPYNTATFESYKKSKAKNIIVNLINSNIFDMDKLDYIMRDAISTGIGAPQIDTQRLFKNMYITEDDFTLVFLHRAVPALQNMIESRDALYMYVYNHHVTVFSDFMYSYIFRRLAHNSDAFQDLIYKITPEQIPASTDTDKKRTISNLSQVEMRTKLGMVPKDYLFSLDAILKQHRSDSDLISLLHNIYYALKFEEFFIESHDNPEGNKIDAFKKQLLRLDLEHKLYSIDFLKEDIQHMFHNIKRVYNLIEKYQKRDFLKPWWKTSFEFANFIDKNFSGSPAHKRLGKWICNNKNDVPNGDEFRSQLAKHVIYITARLSRDYQTNSLLEPLQDNDFFVIQRSAHYFDKDTIGKLNVARKTNEITGRQKLESNSADEYYIDTLTEIFPQRDYYGLYEKNEFYVFSKPLQEEIGTSQERERHYRLIEDIFVFVAKQLTKSGKLSFQDKFVTPLKKTVLENERDSCEKLLNAFVTQKGFIKTQGENEPLMI